MSASTRTWQITTTRTCSRESCSLIISLIYEASTRKRYKESYISNKSKCSKKAKLFSTPTRSTIKLSSFGRAKFRYVSNDWTERLVRQRTIGSIIWRKEPAFPCLIVLAIKSHLLVIPLQVIHVSYII